MNRHYRLVSARAAHRCEYCQAPEAVFNFAFEVEHIVPLVLGGSDSDTNLALACRCCNLRKGVQVEYWDAELNVAVPLFHPRQQLWTDHFSAVAESGTILELSAIGRATIECLEMNSSLQVSARRQWIKLGLFP
jgi:hypothetical protein